MSYLEVDKERFIAWGKTQRHGKAKTAPIVITEKMDGSNCGIHIEDGVIVGIQSRNRSITINQDGQQYDNFGFARWVFDNAEELADLGDGVHYGEWAGPGIQKNPHKLEEKVWFYFSNPFRPEDTLPSCVKKVPVLYIGEDRDEIGRQFGDLWERAGKEGYTPEGIIIYDTATKMRTKMTYAAMKGKWQPGVGKFTGHHDVGGQPLFSGDIVYWQTNGVNTGKLKKMVVDSGTPKMVRCKEYGREDEYTTACYPNKLVKTYKQD